MTRLLLALALLLPDFALFAHAGPPFPIVVDQTVGPWLVSVWTDPDIGTGTFIVVLEPSGDIVPAGTTRVRIAVRPESGRLPEAAYDAVPQPVRYGERHVAEVAFDRGEWWSVRITIAGAGGTGEIQTRVEATPEGSIGPIGMILYLLPFLAMGFIWVKAALRRRRPASSPGRGIEASGRDGRAGTGPSPSAFRRAR
ncbi:MAG: hypothetical protein WEF86_10015 [Gemmatimonadota bacterium]